MSGGPFLDAIYETNAGNPYAIRVQPETITAWNTNGTGPVPAGQPSAQVSKGRRSIGVNARLARFEWTGAVPDGYDPNGIITLPILTQDDWEALVKNQNYAYLGSTMQLVGKTAEAIR